MKITENTIPNTGLYIHIPFCLRKCPYCDFYSVPMDENLADDYLSAVCGVISSGYFTPGKIDTIYFGGGTPSLFGASRLHQILEYAHKYYNIQSGAEISLEANPSSSGGIFKELVSAGFNRVSIGAQSGMDGELRELGRPHGALEARMAVLAAYEAGLDNISCDLMLGVPGQDSVSFAKSVDFIADLPLSHVSAYMLKIEEGTPFASRRRDDIPNEESTVNLYLDAVRRLDGLGFAHYEISNFSKPGYECRHNLKYWRLEPYLGIGPSAHSLLSGKRFYFTPDLTAYIKNPPSCLREDESQDSFETHAMLRLRLTEGLDLRRAGQLYDIDAEGIKTRAEPFVSRGFARLDCDVLSLTAEGFLISNYIIAELVL